MKAKTIKILSLIAFCAVPIAAVAVACKKSQPESKPEKGSNNTQQNQQKQVAPVKTTYSVTYGLNDDQSFVQSSKTFVDQVNEFANKKGDYIKFDVNVKGVKINKQFEREQFLNNELKKFQNFDFKKDLITKPEKDDINVAFENSAEAKEVKEVLEKEFNNFYVPIQWFEKDLKEAIEKVDKRVGLNITKEKAIQDNKLNEYNQVVKMIKDFLAKYFVSFSEDLEFTNINQNIRGGWSLNIDLKNTKTGSSTGNIKLDFKKPDKKLSNKEIDAKNEEASFAKKMVQKILDRLDNTFIENIPKTFYLILLLDDNNQVAAKLSEVITNQSYNFIKNKIPFINYKFVEKFAKKIIAKQSKKVLDLLQNRIKRAQS
ncbi:hypothetical protein [Ureaplasma diversum]|uniref:Lipoprotein n=1 Tax=Ureaplasma diversum NCTC 246 TaxID=1188241 RepID=A0A084EW93_9BACT|nr:hypothetical protein [Ureaplasma diversum]KEZ22235.1 Hypothetical protein, predicted lipoprotein [Ureaplasma diversum NCTC 246]